MAVPKLKRKRSNTSTILQIILCTCLASLCIGALYMSLSKSQDVKIASQQNINTKSGTGGGTKDNTTTQTKGVGNEKGGFLKGSKTEDSLSDMSSDLPETVTLKTSEGDIRIRLRPDLSLASVQYIQKLLESPNPCTNCRIYRAEKPGILQGILKKDGVEKNTVLGDCPEEFKHSKHECPEHDPNCGCHGPIMKQGMIGWCVIIVLFLFQSLCFEFCEFMHCYCSLTTGRLERVVQTFSLIHINEMQRGGTQIILSGVSWLIKSHLM